MTQASPPQQKGKSVWVPSFANARRLTGPLGVIEKVLVLLIPVTAILFLLNVPEYFGLFYYKQQFLGVFLGVSLAAVFLGVAPGKGARKDRVPWYDIVLAAEALGMGLYIFLTYASMVEVGGQQMRPELVPLGLMALLPTLEACRRTNGWIFIGVFAVFLFYTKFAYIFPGPFYGKGMSWERIITFLFVDVGGLYGLVLWIVASILFGFITLGNFFNAVGASDALNDLAYSSFGKFRGGPAKVSVVGSLLFGTISGSAVANVTATGVLTIPLMKKAGYTATYAGAVEAASSTGGQLMPPVMGTTAFVIAEFLQIPYAEVAIACFIPALLYYLIIFVQVDLEAGKIGLKGITGQLPSVLPILGRAWLIYVAAAVLVYTLFFLWWEPGKAAIATIAAVLVFSQLTKATRISPRGLVNLLSSAGRNLLQLTTISAVAGLVIGLIQVSGLGGIIGNLLLAAAGGNLIFMLFLTAVICILLGMGMSTLGVYLILAILVAPALIGAGVTPMAAHLFIFYFGVMSMVTPPICMASYAAATISGASMVRTGLVATRLSLTAYIVPFVFVFFPPMLIGQGFPFQESLIVIAETTIGMLLLIIGINGFVFRRIGWGRRILLMVAGVAVLIPRGTGIPVPIWLLSVVGTSVGFIIILFEWIARRVRSPDAT